MAASTIDLVRKFVLEEFLEGEAPEELTETTPLLTSGILDSVATLKLITLDRLKQCFEISLTKTFVFFALNKLKKYWAYQGI